MPDNARVLVVGTTPDYVDRIRRIKPGKAIFLTNPKLRENAVEPPPSREEEVLCPMGPQDALKAIQRHVKAHGMTLGGIACFDCESMVLAAFLAEELGLDYHSPEAVANCRDKFRAKSLWKASGLPTPDFCLVTGSEQASAFMAENPPPWVTKPVDGSGSSLVFRLDTPADWDNAVAKAEGFFVRQGMESSKAWPMLLEKMATGREYSADFLFVGRQARILRLTAKHRLESERFGITQAYELRDKLLSAKDMKNLEDLFGEAAKALGIGAGICMVDFILNEQGPWLLEMAPRPGGDCLPLLLRKAGGPDTMALAMDFAAKIPFTWKKTSLKPHVGLRIFAPGEGILEKLEPQTLLKDRRVVCFEAIRRPGDEVELPPRDYDSWILANIIYKPGTGKDIVQQNKELSDLVSIGIKAHDS